MLLRAGGLLAAVFVVSVLIRMHMAANGYAARIAGIVCVSSLKLRHNLGRNKNTDSGSLMVGLAQRTRNGGSCIALADR